MNRNRRIQSITVIDSTRSKRAYVTVSQKLPYNVWVRDYRITVPTLLRVDRLSESGVYYTMRNRGIDKNVSILHLERKD